jgi:hypothetical protein
LAHAAPIGEVQQVPILTGVLDLLPTTQNGTEQPLPQIAYVEFDGVHNPIEVALRVR